MRRIFPALLIAAAILAGCMPDSEAPGLSASSEPVSSSSSSQAASSLPAPAPKPAPPPPAASPEKKRYIGEVVAETLKKIVRPGMDDLEKVQAAFEYMIENTYFADPVALDIWRIRGGGETPSYVENRALSPLVFGLGSCEDYACALVILLRGMGFEARYVPGLTYSVEGILVDHAWTVVKIGDIWYHLDSQLEDNIVRDNTLRYRYFLRGDTSLSASHRWGQNLIDYGGLSEEQNEEIRRDFLYEPCPEDFPTPQPKTIRSAPPPDIPAILREVEAERRQYEQLHGKLPPVELNTTPPVFHGNAYP